MKANNVCIIGKMAPPIGGVTIYTSRLVEYFGKFPEVKFLPLEFHNIWLIIQSCAKTKIIHLNTSNPKVRVLFALLCFLFRSRLIITYHGNLGRFNFLNNWLDNISILLCKYPVVLNENSFRVALRYNSNTKLISSFIPPVKEEALAPKYRDRIITFRSKGLVLVCTNAYNVSFDKNGSEIYGITDLIRCIIRLPKFKLIISDPSGKYQEFIQSKNSAFADSVFWISEPHNFCEVLKLSDFFVRNTTTDGDSLSIHESLYFGTPVLATGIVSRPKGCIIYNNMSELGENLMNYLKISNSFQVLNNDYNSVEKIQKLYFNNSE
jgi:glycosyltransferase involved in cell wall biosynthesis